MSSINDIENMPVELNELEALEIACGRDIYWVQKKLESQVSVLIECEKQMIPYLYMKLRTKLRERGLRMDYLDGRSAPAEDGRPAAPGGSVLRNMIAQVTESVRGATEQRIVVLPHLDLLTSGSQTDIMTTEAREIIPLLYENPRVVFLAFKDPNFNFFKVIENIFPARRKILGIERQVLPSLILQREARKFPLNFNFHRLYQYVSGLNPVRIRQVLSRLEGIDFPEYEHDVFRQLREFTMDGDMELPNVDLQKDIGGYVEVKKKIESDILGILRRRDELVRDEDLAEIDAIVPKGVIFHGPPGTGKTFFAKAMANALNATIIIVSGPELKSMWVGQSEENIRKIFFKARQSAPSIIVFDELDSFASSRSARSSTEVNHSMVNQLLTEMDGFRKEELVFVIGTTNYVSSLDPALLRPGRFEMKIEIPFPNNDDRLAILNIYNKKLRLELSEEQINHIAQKTGELLDPMTGSPFTGDHLYSVMRFLKRLRIRENRSVFSKEDIYLAMRGGEKKLSLTEKEKRVVACHESGHAIVAMSIKETTPVERISIDSDCTDMLGYLKQEEREDAFVLTRRQMLADLVILMAGREAELLEFQDLSVGSENDIMRANRIAADMVGKLGMSEAFGVRICEGEISDETMRNKDRIIADILERARKKARSILESNHEALKLLSESLIRKKVMERAEIEALVGGLEVRDSATVE